MPAGLDIFFVFLKLGLTAFGGPVAHLGYFRDEFVVRRQWLDEARYADLVALCQFIPGPASSQVGFSLGVLRGGGLAGGLAAWLGFTLPSALLLTAGAFGAAMLTGPLAHGVLHGLKLVAVAVVAQALWGMARTLTPDWQRGFIAAAALLIASTLQGIWVQAAVIATGALAGLLCCRDAVAKIQPQSGAVGVSTAPGAMALAQLRFAVTRRAGMTALLLFFVLLAGAPLLARSSGEPLLVLFDAFYRAGALVFGGGHVVLPLLEAEMVTPGWVSPQSFLAGYGMAQAAPGPLFTFAAYLGAQAAIIPDGATAALNSAGHAGALPAMTGTMAAATLVSTHAAVALCAIFLPGLLLVYGMLPFWDGLRALQQARRMMAGANAAVVGLLAAALYDPVWTGAIHDVRDAAVALAGFLLLTRWRVPPWCVVLLLAATGAVL